MESQRASLPDWAENRELGCFYVSQTYDLLDLLVAHFGASFINDGRCGLIGQLFFVH